MLYLTRNVIPLSTLLTNLSLNKNHPVFSLSVVSIGGEEVIINANPIVPVG